MKVERRRKSIAAGMYVPFSINKPESYPLRRWIEIKQPAFDGLHSTPLQRDESGVVQFEPSTEGEAYVLRAALP
jgi:hypothetical protein